MPDLKSSIRKAIFYNSQRGARPVPEGIIVANCRVQGFEEAEVLDELERLVEDGELRPEDDGYLRVDA